MSNVRALVYTRPIASMHYGLRKASRARLLLISRCTAFPRANTSMHFGPRRPRVLAFSCSRATPGSKRQHKAHPAQVRLTPPESIGLKPGERYRRLAPRGHTRTGFHLRGKCSRGLHPVGSLGALGSGAPSTSALTLPSKGRPTAGHTGSLRHGQPRRWPPLMSNVRPRRCPQNHLGNGGAIPRHRSTPLRPMPHGQRYFELRPVQRSR